MKKKSPKSIRTQLVTSNIVAITLMVALISVCVYFGATRLQIQNAQRLNSELVETMGKSFDGTEKAFKHIINYITISHELDEALKKEHKTHEEFSESNVLIKKAITDKSILFNELEGWYIYDNTGELRAHQRKKYNKQEADILYPNMDIAWFSDTGKITSFVMDGRLVFTRKIISFTTLEDLGYFVAIYDSELLKQKLGTILGSDKRFAVIFDTSGSIMVHNNPSNETMKYITDNMDFSTVGKSQIAHIPELGKTIVDQYISPSSGWRLVSAVSLKEITRFSDLMLVIIITSGFLGLLFGTAMQNFASQHIIEPINGMVNVVNKVEQGDYSQQIPPQQSRELGILAVSFNQLVKTTDILINQVLRHEIMYRDMQLEALQAQIRPHILYNMLECINWLAEFGRKDDIRRVTIAFSNLMKSIASGEKYVSIDEELSYTEDFLAIYQILLVDKLTYEINRGSKSFGDAKIPRLSIQPLVENAVIHGIKKSSEKGMITVNVVPSEEGIIISVIDNGIGIDEQVVEKINNYAMLPDEKQTTDFGIGLRNVIDRLWLVYQGKSRFSVTSSPGWGTSIDMLIPLEEEGENELLGNYPG